MGAAGQQSSNDHLLLAGLHSISGCWWGFWLRYFQSSTQLTFKGKWEKDDPSVKKNKQSDDRTNIGPICCLSDEGEETCLGPYPGTGWGPLSLTWLSPCQEDE